MDAERTFDYALRAALFLNVLAILAVFYTRTLVVKLTRFFEKAVSVPLSVLLLLLFAIHEALFKLKLKTGCPREGTQLHYRDIDGLFWSDTAATSIFVSSDLQSLTLRASKGSDHNTSVCKTTVTPRPEEQSADSPKPPPEQKMFKALAPKLSQKQLIVKAGWNMHKEYKEYKEYKNYATETIQLVSAST